MNTRQKAKLINDLKALLPSAKDIELEITKDELSKELFNKPYKENLGLHPIYRAKAKMGIKKTNNKEALAIMYLLITKEIERRNKNVSKISKKES